jgi:hypothetical protein
LSYGANITIKNNQNQSPLDLVETLPANVTRTVQLSMLKQGSKKNIVKYIHQREYGHNIKRIKQ